MRTSGTLVEEVWWCRLSVIVIIIIIIILIRIIVANKPVSRGPEVN